MSISMISSSDQSGTPGSTNNFLKSLNINTCSRYATVFMITRETEEMKPYNQQSFCNCTQHFAPHIHKLTCFLRLAEVCTLNGRGRQSIRKSLSPAHLNAYRASVMKSQGDRITTDDVKRKCQYVVELITIMT